MRKHQQGSRQQKIIAACRCVRLAPGIQPSHEGRGHCKQEGKFIETGESGGHAKFERESGWTDMTAGTLAIGNRTVSTSDLLFVFKNTYP